MRNTTDRGRHWSAVPAPPARYEFQPGHGTRSSVSQIRFADAADGWAFGPGLWATHDGGVSWHRVSTHGQPVQSLETAGGWVLAVLSRCAPQGSPCNGVAVYSSPVAADSWRQIPGAGGAYRSASVLVSGNTGYVTDVPDLGPTAAVAVQARPADGAAEWSSLRSPCRRAWGVWGAWLAATPGGTLVMACANQPSAGWQPKRAYPVGQRRAELAAARRPILGGLPRRDLHHARGHHLPLRSALRRVGLPRPRPQLA